MVGVAPRRTTRNTNVGFWLGTGTGVGALAEGIPVTVRRGDGNYLLVVFSSTCHAGRTLESLPEAAVVEGRSDDILTWMGEVGWTEGETERVYPRTRDVVREDIDGGQRRTVDYFLSRGISVYKA